MKRKNAIIVLAVVALITIVLGIIGCVDIYQEYTCNVSKVIEIKDGKSDEKTFSVPFELKHTGNYNVVIEYGLDNTPGFLTGFVVVTNGSDNMRVDSASGILMDYNRVKLQKGKNEVRFTILANNDDYADFKINTHEKDSNVHYGGVAPWDYFSDGTYSLEYKVTVRRSYSDIATFLSIMGVIAGLDLALLISVLFKKGELAASDLDERMRMGRYKGAIRGFYVTMVGLILLFLFNFTGASVPIESSVQILIVILAGTGVYAVSSIMNDGYFALNESKKAYLILFSVMAVVCLAGFIFNLTCSSIIIDGVLTGNVNPFFLFIEVVTIITSIVVKDQRDRSED